MLILEPDSLELDRKWTHMQTHKTSNQTEEIRTSQWELVYDIINIR